MMHLVRLIQRRRPQRAGKLLVVIVAVSAAFLASGTWMLAR